MLGQDSRAIGSLSLVMLILGIALTLGGGLRFYGLGVEEMNRGESAAWTAASAPDVQSVRALSRQLDPGKSALYDLALHEWIATFGDGVGAMRTLSAILGTLTIVLVFATVREILRSFDTGAEPLAVELAAAFAALLFACNFEMITYARLLRMYALMLAAVLAHIFFFVRAHRKAGFVNFAAAGIFAALAVASNQTALFFFVAEGVWLAYLWIFARAQNRSDLPSVARPTMALALGAMVFAPVALAAGRIGLTALRNGILIGIEPQPPWWPLRALKVMAGNAAFGPFVALSLFAIWRQFNRARLAVRFILCWLIIPFAVIMVLSYTITPLMVERYVLSSLVGFLVLTALGIASVPSNWLRYGIATLLVAQSLAHLHHHWRQPEDIQWQEAAAFASSSVSGDKTIAVIPPGEPLLVLRYYLTQSKRDMVVDANAKFDGKSWSFHCGPEPVAIVQTELPRKFLGTIQSCYPRKLRTFRRVEVISR